MFSNWTVNQIFLSLSILKVVLLLTTLLTLMFRIGRKFFYVFVTEHSYSWGITPFALKSVAKSTCTSALATEEGNTFESQNGVAVVQTSKGKLWFQTSSCTAENSSFLSVSYSAFLKAVSAGSWHCLPP